VLYKSKLEVNIVWSSRVGTCSIASVHTWRRLVIEKFKEYFSSHFKDEILKLFLTVHIETLRNIALKKINTLLHSLQNILVEVKAR
jgi:hypothetical protein